MQLIDIPKATAALIHAAYEGKASKLRSLLDECMLVDHTTSTTDDCKPVSPNLARDVDGMTALIIACERGHHDIVEVLLDH